MKKVQKHWLLVQANPRLDSGSAWMFAVCATRQDEAEAKFKKWAERSHKRFSLVTVLGHVSDDPDYARRMDKADKRKAVIPFGRRNWSMFKS